MPPTPGKIPPPHAVSAVLTAPKIAKRIASVLTLLNLVTDIAINSQKDIVVVLRTRMSTVRASGRSGELVSTFLIGGWVQLCYCWRLAGLVRETLTPESF